MDWVPDAENAVVPDVMRRVCGACPLQVRCLQVAVQSGSEGYWAATTTQDRRHMLEAGEVSVAAGERLQAGERARAAHELACDREKALHPAGEGNLWWYRRRGCRCVECRRHNADRRAEERCRSRQSCAA